MFVPCSQFGYQHLTVNHSKNFKDPTTGACRNTCKKGWAHSKRDMVDFKKRFKKRLKKKDFKKRFKKKFKKGLKKY